MSIEFEAANPDSFDGEPDDCLLTPSEVADMLRVPLSWVYAQTRGRSKAGLPFVKMGHYVRFDRAAVRKFIASNSCVGK